jgi:hypothetical protein
MKTDDENGLVERAIVLSCPPASAGPRRQYRRRGLAVNAGPAADPCRQKRSQADSAGDMRLPDLGGVAGGATAGPLPQRYLEPVCYDTTEAGRGEPAVKLQCDRAAVLGDARGAVGKATALRPRRAERASAAGVLMPTPTSRMVSPRRSMYPMASASAIVMPRLD